MDCSRRDISIEEGQTGTRPLRRFPIEFRFAMHRKQVPNHGPSSHTSTEAQSPSKETKPRAFRRIGTTGSPRGDTHRRRKMRNEVNDATHDESSNPLGAEPTVAARLANICYINLSRQNGRATPAANNIPPGSS